MKPHRRQKSELLLSRDLTECEERLMSVCRILYPVWRQKKRRAEALLNQFYPLIFRFRFRSITPASVISSDPRIV